MFQSETKGKSGSDRGLNGKREVSALFSAQNRVAGQQSSQMGSGLLPDLANEQAERQSGRKNGSGSANSQSVFSHCSDAFEWDVVAELNDEAAFRAVSGAIATVKPDCLGNATGIVSEVYSKVRKRLQVFRKIVPIYNDLCTLEAADGYGLAIAANGSSESVFEAENRKFSRSLAFGRAVIRCFRAVHANAAGEKGQRHLRNAEKSRSRRRFVAFGKGGWVISCASDQRSQPVNAMVLGGQSLSKTSYENNNVAISNVWVRSVGERRGHFV